MRPLGWGGTLAVLYATKLPLAKPARPAAVNRVPNILVAAWKPSDLRQKERNLPPQVEALLSDDTPRDQTRKNWAAMRDCFDQEDQAIQAVERNTGTILPYLNVPSNIRGNYAYLVEILGKHGALDVCMKNPGVLSCNPAALSQSSADDIVRTANVVDWVESLPPFRNPTVRNNLDKIIFFIGASIFAKRLIIDCAGATCGSASIS